MTDRFLPIDAALWSLAVALLVFAVWLVRRDVKDDWDPAAFFAAALRAALGSDAGAYAPASPPDSADPPGDVLGAGLSWDDLAGGSSALQAVIARRMEGVRVVWLEAPALALDGVATTVCSADAVAALFKRPEERFVLAAHHEAMTAIRLLHADAALRDRLRAVLLIAPRLDAEWLGAHFTQKAFDVEVAREVPWFTLRTGPDADAQRLPAPAPAASGFATIVVGDLGLIEPSLVADPRTGRAVAALLAALG